MPRPMGRKASIDLEPAPLRALSKKPSMNYQPPRQSELPSICQTSLTASDIANSKTYNDLLMGFRQERAHMEAALKELRRDKRNKLASLRGLQEQKD